MKLLENKIIEWFLRIALSAGFLSAVADRFGLWSKELSAWGNWASFIKYTQSLNPYLSESIITVLGYSATALEIIFGILLLINFKTNTVAKASGILLLLFALSMTFSKSIKVPLDYSVFTASACAFALSILVKSNQDKGATNKV
jgi:thiosulfate dehydrogenase (quinone) large subunit